MVIVGAWASSAASAVLVSAAGVLVLVLEFDGAGAGTASSPAAEDVGDAGGSETGMGFSSGCGSAGLLDGDAQSPAGRTQGRELTPRSLAADCRS